MAFRYETHLHTRMASICGKSTGAEHVRYYKELGYQGIIVTDHFFGGNCAVPRDLPWHERVDWFCSGYEDALIAGQKCGLDVFFGWEQRYERDEYLIYGPGKDWLLAHPDIEQWSRARQLREIHLAGGAVIQAHPFRVREYISRILLGARYCDGIEAVNTGNQPYCDLYALRYGEINHLLMTAGSDNHDSAHLPPDHFSGIELDERLTSIWDYARILRERRPFKMIIPDGRLDISPAEIPDLRCYSINESNSEDFNSDMCYEPVPWSSLADMTPDPV